MGYGNQRYRPLGSINRDTVARLVPVWNYGPDNSQGRAIDCRLGHAMTGSALVPYRTEGLNGVHRPVRARSAFPG